MPSGASVAPLRLLKCFVALRSGLSEPPVGQHHIAQRFLEPLYAFRLFAHSLPQVRVISHEISSSPRRAVGRMMNPEKVGLSRNTRRH